MGTIKHGAVREDVTNYNRWVKIMHRCYNIADKGYERYGKRNIKVYRHWIKDPLSFIHYIKSLDNFGVENYTLDRINNDGDYEPDNLRWASKSEQSINRRKKSTNTSSYTGVHLLKRTNMYQSKININKKKIHLGTFDTIENAIIARNMYIISNNIKEYKIQ